MSGVRALLVTSSVTYVPGNYGAVEAVIERCPEHVAGVVLVDIKPAEVLLQAAKAAFAGCYGIALELVKNLGADLGRSREAWLRARGIPCRRVKTMNDPHVVAMIRDGDEGRIDVVVNMRTRCIYRRDVLAAPRLGCLNVHHGILPTYRGLMCDLHALAEKRPAGFSIHTMNERIDDGAVLHTEEVSRGDTDYIAYLKKGPAQEARAVAALLDAVAATGALPSALSDALPGARSGGPANASHTPSRPSFVMHKALDLHTARRLQMSGVRM